MSQITVQFFALVIKIVCRLKNTFVTTNELSRAWLRKHTHREDSADRTWYNLEHRQDWTFPYRTLHRLATPTCLLLDLRKGLRPHLTYIRSNTIYPPSPILHTSTEKMYTSPVIYWSSYRTHSARFSLIPPWPFACILAFCIYITLLLPFSIWLSLYCFPFIFLPLFTVVPQNNIGGNRPPPGGKGGSPNNLLPP